MAGDARLIQRVAFDGEPSPRRAPTEIPISYPKEWTAQVAIDRQAPRGVVYWRVACAQGGTSCRPFIVSDLPNVIEQESNSTPRAAQRVPIPAAVNGRISGERDVDYFAVELKRNERLSCDVIARRLGSPIDPIVEIRGPDGELAVVKTHAFGEDISLGLIADRAGAYTIRVANVSFHGDPSYVYRLHLTRQPLAIFAYPPGGEARAQAQVAVTDIFGETQQRTISLRDELGESTYFHSAYGNGFQLASAATAVVVESEPNDTPDAATSIFLNRPAFGQSQRRDRDHFVVDVKKDRPVFLTCRGFPAGRGALPVVTVVAGSDSKTIARARSVDAADRVCRLNWTPGEDGRVIVRVEDIRAAVQGGSDFIYELTLRAGRPDFQLHAAADVVNGRQGEKTTFDVRAERQGGFDEAIDLQVVGLPEGAKVEGGPIPAGKSTAKLTIAIDGEAAAVSSELKIEGSATVGDRQVTRTVQCRHLGRDADNVGVNAAIHPRLFLTIAHQPVFRLHCSEAYLYAHRGSVFPYPMTMERLNGFEGDILLQIGDRQNRDLDGIEMLPITVTADQTDFFMPIYLPETMHINIQSQSQLYTQAYAQFEDKQGRRQSVLVVSEKRNMLRTLPTVAKLRTLTPRLRAAPGATVECRVELKRTSNFTSPLEVRLEDGADDGFEISPTVIPAGASEAAILVKTPADWPAGSRRQLTLRGEGPLAGGCTFVSECRVTIVAGGDPPPAK